MSKRILVTGGAGYIGSFVIRDLKEKGFDVFVIDNFYAGHEEVLKGFEWEKVDIVEEKEKLNNIFKKNKFDAVIHLAALIEVKESCENPLIYYKTNFAGTLNLLEFMVKYKVGNIIFSSTAAVYGIPKKTPIGEEDSVVPINPYGESKLMVEKILPWFEKAYAIKHIVFRYFNAAGASLDGNIGDAHKNISHIIPNLILSAIKDQAFNLFGDDYPTPDGTCIRDYIHVLDLATAHTKGVSMLLSGMSSNVFNLGSGYGYSNKEVINAVERVVNPKIKINVCPRREGDSDKLFASNEKAKRILKWLPKYNLDDIVGSSYQWHKSHPKGY